MRSFRPFRPYIISWLLLNLPLALMAAIWPGYWPAALVAAVTSALMLSLWMRERQTLIKEIASGQLLTPGWLRLSEQAEVAVADMRKAQQRELGLAQEQAAHWQQLLNHISQPVLLTNGVQRVVFVNPAAVEAFGDKVVGLLLGQAIRAPELLTNAEMTLKDGLPRQLEAVLSEGEQDWIYRISLRRLPNQDHLLVFAEDITELRMQERARVDFVANASHELRTPLASVLGFVETLLGPARDDADARERFLTIIHEEASRMSRMVNSLLSLSQVEQSKEAPDEEIDLVPVVQEVVRGLEMQSKHRQMPIQLTLPDHLPLVGDDDQLAQVIRNLLDNALKYGRSGTPILLSAQQVAANGDNPGWEIKIQDQGDGIPPEALPRLSERFYRVDKARARSIGGSGLGLAIVKHILQRHGGNLKIDSVLGQGSTFTLHLPAAIKPMQAAA
ncbi:MAG: PAS domain-containing protein [Alphaproteobacteria bacterium]|nr:PAS domain-containing protein [Alphaproteobacteria bacterium]